MSSVFGQFAEIRPQFACGGNPARFPASPRGVALDAVLSRFERRKRRFGSYLRAENRLFLRAEKCVEIRGFASKRVDNAARLWYTGNMTKHTQYQLRVTGDEAVVALLKAHMDAHPRTLAEAREARRAVRMLFDGAADVEIVAVTVLPRTARRL